MSLPGSTPLQSFLGGVRAAFPVNALLSFNNDTFGISGFIHDAARGRLEVGWPLQHRAGCWGFRTMTPPAVRAARRRRFKGPSNSPIPRRNTYHLLTTHR
jgi:hypothetical protein